MDKSPSSDLPDQLFENGGWVRRLACRMLYDKSQADDVVQEVWITALRVPPSRPHALAAWLKTVVRSVVSRVNRLHRRRRELGSRLEPRGNAESEADIAERLETQRRITEAVAQLKEPYRSAVYLHYYEGLQPIEIARRFNVPGSTIRNRLSRALVLLREKLSREHGGPDRMRSVLAALIIPFGLLDSADAWMGTESAAGRGTRPRSRPPASRRSGILSAGGLAAGMAALGVLAFFSRPAAVPAAARSEGASVDLRAGTPQATPAMAVGNPLAPDAEALRAAAGRPAAPDTAAISAGRALRVVDGRTGNGVPRAAVYAFERTDARSLPLGETDASGRLTVEEAILRRRGFLVLAAGYLERREAPALRSPDDGPLELDLEPEVEAAVEVLLPEGLPAAGALVAIQPRPRGMAPPPAEGLRAGPDGRAAFVQRYRDIELSVELDGFATLTALAQAPLTRFRLEPGRAVSAIILAEDGSAVSGCRVQWTSRLLAVPTCGASGADGRFSMGRLAAGDAITVSFRHPGHPPIRLVSPPPESGDWIFRLPHGIRVEGRAVDATGAPPSPGASAFILVPEGGGEAGGAGFISALNTPGLPARREGPARLVPLFRSAIDRDGKFSLGPVRAAAGPLYLFIHHPRLANHLERLGDLGPLGEIRLQAGAVLHGRLVSPGGEPIAGAQLHVGEIWSNGIEGMVRRVRTAADGSFQLEGLPQAPDEKLPGEDESGGAPARREELFITAFPPDELLELDGRPAGEGVAPGRFSIAGAAALGKPVELTGAARGAGVRLDIRLCEPGGFPLQAWTPAVLLDGAGGAFEGVIGAHLRNPRFFACDSIDAPQLPDGCTALFFPEGRRWEQLELGPIEAGGWLEVELEPVAGPPRELRVSGAAGVPLACRQVVAAIPFGAAAPARFVSLGKTDGRGSISMACLPPGRHLLGVLPAVKGMAGEEKEPGPQPGRLLPMEVEPEEILEVWLK